LSSKIRESKLLPSKPALIENLKSNKFDYDKENNSLYQREMVLLNIAVDNSEMFIVEFREYKIPKNKISPYCKTYATLKLLIQFEHLKIHEKYICTMLFRIQSFHFNQIISTIFMQNMPI
jgi:superfamily II helicase